MVIEVKIKGESYAAYEFIDVVSKGYKILSIPYRLIKSFEVTLTDVALELTDGSIIIRIPKTREVIYALKRRGIKEIKYPFNLTSIVFLSSFLVFILIVSVALLTSPSYNISIAFLSLTIFYLGLVIGNTLNFSLLTYSHAEAPENVMRKVRVLSKILGLKSVPSVIMSKLLTREFSAGVVPLTNSIILVWLPNDEKASDYVIAHELAHLKKRHGLKSIATIFVIIAITYFTSLLLNALKTPTEIGFTIILALVSSALFLSMLLSYYQELEAHLIAISVLGHEYFEKWVNFRLELIKKGLKLLEELGIGFETVISKLETVSRPSKFAERLKVWLRNYPHPPTYFIKKLSSKGKVNIIKFIYYLINDLFSKSQLS